MASSLNLDRSDPGVDELVSTWEDGGTYRVELEITQTKSSPNAATYDVIGITDISETMEAEPEEEAEPAPAPARGKVPAIKY